MLRRLSVRRSPIVGLLGWRSPSAVAGFVVPVVVLAVNGVDGRGPATHVEQEGPEVVSPSGAHRYSAPTVIGVLLVGGIEASPLRMRPDSIFGSAMGLSMHDAPGGCHLPLKASARTYGARAQVSDGHEDFLSAITVAQPVAPNLAARGDARRSTDGYQTTKAPAREIYSLWHRRNRSARTAGRGSA